jgi:pimeloyl-ACP methyl ester carboxylesterase
MPMVNVRDTKLYYETAGEGDVPLLIIHGAGAGAWIWEEQLKRLSSDFTCVVYDRRGHSRSEPGTETVSYQTHVEDAAALIVALGLDRPFLVGNSAGAGIAIELMHRYPEKVRGAVAAEPALFSLQPGAAEEAKKIIGPVVDRALDGGTPADAIELFLQTIAPEFWSVLDEPTRDRFRENGSTFLTALQTERPTITAEDLQHIHHPVLVVTGSESPELMRSLALAAVENLPNARSIEIENSGHVAQMEKPDEFAQAVKAFAGVVAGSVAAPSN